jgi:hypothetical protein
VVCRSVHISPSCFESCSWFVEVFIFHPLDLRVPTNHEQLSKQEGEIWTLLQIMNSSQHKRGEYEHSYKPWSTLKSRGRNMNTPTNHEQLSNQEGEIWTLLQTMNNSQIKRVKYEHFYKPWTALKTIGRNRFESCSWFVGVFIFLPLDLRVDHGL